MRIVSLNAWGGALFAPLSEWIAQAGADVLCLQEVPRTAGATGWTTFADAARTLPQRADLVADVQAVLPRHRALFDASDAGPVTVDDRPARQEFGLAMFVGPQLSVLSRHSRFVHGAFAEHDDWPTDGRPRIAQAVRIGDPRGWTACVVHVHGLRVGAGKHDTPQRHAQARALAELVEQTRQPGDLTVVCGDLNLLPTSETFAVLGRLGLVNLVGTADTRTSHYAKAVRHASYLLVSDPSAVRRFEIVAEPEVSDHRALLVELGPVVGAED